MDYKQYSPEELAADSHFIEWVKQPDQENTAFWESWLAQNPDKVEAVEVAQQLVKLWRVKRPPISKGSFSSVWEKIQADRVTWEAKNI